MQTSILWIALLRLLLLLEIVDASPQHILDGYAFDCGGIMLGFRGSNQIYCLDSPDEPCGTYDRRGTLLTGHTTILGSFLAHHVEVHDGIVVSFQSDMGVACHAVSLDWSRYSKEYMGLVCPVQNASGELQQDRNHFSLGRSGDVALRSPLKFANKARKIIRDSYGIYVWHDDETVSLYFGPQRGQPLTILEGKLSRAGELFIDNYEPSGPCIHDGLSAIENTTVLPTRQGPKSSQSDMLFYDDYFQWSQEHNSYYSGATLTEQVIYWVLLMVAFAGLALMRTSC